MAKSTTSTTQKTTSTQNTTSGSTTQTQGGSQSHQTGGSTSHQVGGSTSQQVGGSTAHQTGGARSVTGATGQVNQPTQQAYNGIWNPYQQSEAVTQAQQYLADTMNNRPGQYQSTFTDQLNNLYEQIMNRPKFNYDMNADVLYQQYADQYRQQGKNAMQDTIGQGAALTGGYDNSYAQVAGRQQYQQYLNQLNQQLPQLYSQAYQQYAQEGEQLNNLYGIASDRENQDYARFRDTVSDWQADRNYGLAAYQDARDFDYNAYEKNRELASQEYWNQRNAQQTSDQNNWSDTNESNWANTNQNNWSDTNESNWADTASTNWQNSQTNGWQNTNSSQTSTSTSTSTGSGGSGGGRSGRSGRSSKSGGEGEMKMFTNSNKSNGNKLINSLKSLQSRTDRSKLDNAVNTYLSARVKDGSMTHEDVDWLQHEYYNNGHWNFRTGG